MDSMGFTVMRARVGWVLLRVAGADLGMETVVADELGVGFAVAGIEGPCGMLEIGITG